MTDDVCDIQDGRSALIIGDSLVAGEGSNNNFGWSQQIAQKLSADIVGVCGATSGDILAHLPDKAYTQVVVQIGTNDARFRHDKNATETSLKQYAENLLAITEHFEKKSSNVRFAFVDLLYVEERKTVLFRPDRSYFDKSIKSFSKQLQAFCESHDHLLISLISSINGFDQLSDGLHPNRQCYADIALLVDQAIEGKLRVV